MPARSVLAPPPPPDQLLTAAQVAERTQLSERALRTLRSKNAGPPVTVPGGTAQIRYRASDVNRWIAAGCP